MTEPAGHAAGPVIGGHKVNVKVIAALVGVAVLLFVMRRKSSSTAASSNDNTALTGSSATDGSTLGDAYTAMMSQLQQDNTAMISQQLSDLQSANQAALNAQLAKDRTSTEAAVSFLQNALRKAVPPGTVHNPVTAKPNGGSGVPSPAGHYYTVRAGDTLSGIAGSAHVSDWHRLVNSRTDARIDAHPNVIVPGERVWIPA